MLQELVTSYYHDEEKYQKEYKEKHPDLAQEAINIIAGGKLEDEFEHRMSHLSPEEQLQLARDYNALKEPTQLQTQFMAQMDIGFRTERLLNHNESREVMQAYGKCAQAMEHSDFKDGKRQSLGYHIKHFVRVHPETATAALEIYDKHLSDLNLIDGVRSCMSRNDKLLDKGFAVIHKMADNICKKENNPLAASESLRLAFADLYGYYPIKEPEKLDKITEHFIDFTPQMERRHQSNLQYNITTRGLSSEKARLQTEILWSCFSAMDENNPFYGEPDTRPFAEIYSDKKAQYAEKLQQAALDKVKNKIKRKAETPDKEASQLTVPNSLKYNLIYAGPRKPNKTQFQHVQKRRQRYWGFEDPKPEGGLWTSFASKDNPDIGEWQQYCDKEMPIWNEHKLKGSWHIVPTEDCRVLEFNHIDDIRKYIRTSYDSRNPCSDFELEQGFRDYWSDKGNPLYVDYQAMSKDYDIFIYPEDAGERNPLFGDWTRSGLVMNMDKVKVMENEEYAQFKEAEVQKFSSKINSGLEADKLKIAGNTEHNKQIMQILRMVRNTDKSKK